jgi:hypothetical protein
MEGLSSEEQQLRKTSEKVVKQFINGLVKNQETSLPMAMYISHPGVGFLDIEAARNGKHWQDLQMDKKTAAGSFGASIPLRDTFQAKALKDLRAFRPADSAIPYSQEATPWYQDLKQPLGEMKTSVSSTSGHMTVSIQTARQLLGAGIHPEEALETLVDDSERQIALYAWTIAEYRDYVLGRQKEWKMIPQNPGSQFLTETDSKIERDALDQAIRALPEEIQTRRRVLLDLELLETEKMRTMITNKEDMRNELLRKL